MLSTVVSLITALGVGSLVGAFFQAHFERQKHLNEQEHELKSRRYLCTLILLFAKVDPEARPHLFEVRPDLKGATDLDKELRLELFNAVLFASDDVIAAMAQFVAAPSYSAYIKTAAAMRRDLWNKKTSINETSLARVTEALMLKNTEAK
jgi:hypothetical protein